MITDIIITLYEFNSKGERQFIFFSQIVLGANRISYLKGIEKIPEKRTVFQNAL